MNIYLYLDEGNVIRDVVALDYKVIADNYIPYNEVDKTLVGMVWDKNTNTVIDNPNPEPVLLTKWEFRSLFTMDEMISFYDAAKTDTVIQVYLDDIKTVDIVELNYEPTIQGIQYLVQKGLLTQERATEILNYRK